MTMTKVECHVCDKVEPRGGNAGRAEEVKEETAPPCDTIAGGFATQKNMSAGQNRKVYTYVGPDVFPSPYRRARPRSPRNPYQSPVPPIRSLFFLARSRRVHAPPRTRAHSSTWLAGFTCARKRREPTPGVPAARRGAVQHGTCIAPLSIPSSRWTASAGRGGRGLPTSLVVGQRWYIRERDREGR